MRVQIFQKGYHLSRAEVVSLLQTTGECSVKELSYFLGVTSAVSDGLVKKGICEYFEEEAPKYIPSAEAKPKQQPVIFLTDDSRKPMTICSKDKIRERRLFPYFMELQEAEKLLYL